MESFHPKIQGLSIYELVHGLGENEVNMLKISTTFLA
jgi:hypothetical protein